MDWGFHLVDILFLGVLFWVRYDRRSCLIRTDCNVFKERVLDFLGSAFPIVVLVLVATVVAVPAEYHGQFKRANQRE
jgi:hypothetical protein